MLLLGLKYRRYLVADILVRGGGTEARAAGGSRERVCVPRVSF